MTGSELIADRGTCKLINFKSTFDSNFCAHGCVHARSSHFGHAGGERVVDLCPDVHGVCICWRLRPEVVPVWLPLIRHHLLARVADEETADVFAHWCHLLPALVRQGTSACWVLRRQRVQGYWNRPRKSAQIRRASAVTMGQAYHTEHRTQNTQGAATIHHAEGN